MAAIRFRFFYVLKSGFCCQPPARRPRLNPHCASALIQKPLLKPTIPDKSKNILIELEKICFVRVEKHFEDIVSM